MASGETKFLALHRLDFYKQKKNWKLPEDVRKVPPPSPKSTNKLKETHGVVEEFPEPEFDLEQVSLHNKAIQGETDDTLEPQLPGDEPPSLPSLESVYQRPSWSEKIWNRHKTEAFWKNRRQASCGTEVKDVLEELAYEQYEGACHQDSLWRPDPASQLELNPKVDPLDRHLEYLTPEQMRQTAEVWLTLHNDPVQQECADTYEEYGASCGTEDKDVREELAYEQYEGACHQDSLWRPDPASQLELNPAVDPVDRHLENENLTPEQMRQTAEEWLTLHNDPVQQECADTYEEYGFEDGSADFVRGSHYAPHSTEIDLSITQECGCTSKNLYGLSVRQLAQAIQRHHSALKLLLGEQALREKLCYRSPVPLESLMRDTDPLRPDSVLSGSHRVPSATGYDANTGRGRGRKQQHRLFTIVMGRPYWDGKEIVQ